MCARFFLLVPDGQVLDLPRNKPPRLGSGATCTRTQAAKARETRAMWRCKTWATRKPPLTNANKHANKTPNAASLTTQTSRMVIACFTQPARRQHRAAIQVGTPTSSDGTTRRPSLAAAAGHRHLRQGHRALRRPILLGLIAKYGY